jgi:hypothetical protein
MSCTPPLPFVSPLRTITSLLTWCYDLPASRTSTLPSLRATRPDASSSLR